MNDSVMYSGVDGVPDGGMFGNETIDKETQQKLQDQDRQLKELTPKLQELLAVIDAEIASVFSIRRFTSATTQPEKDIRAELQAAALYEQYLNVLKTKFILAMNETKKGQS